MKPHFTVDGSPALEKHLERVTQKVLTGVESSVPPRMLNALFLGGGYGRGEGGVLRTENGDHPYNDMEFYVCLHGNRLLNERKYRKLFHHLGENLSAREGIEVEFKLTSLDKLKQEANTMFFYDLACGHKILRGEKRLLANCENQENKIPLFEATRLLMNRCSGLLFAEEKLQRVPFTAEDADFVGRNQAKAQLAFGDVLLTAFGQYHWSCRVRAQRLRKLPNQAFSGLEAIRCHHAQGVEFKLHPQKRNWPREHFLPLQQDLLQLGRELWLWLESRRLQHPFPTPCEYSLSPQSKCPETNPVRNFLVNLRSLGGKHAVSSRAFRYPRERLLRALPLLLWERPLLSDPTILPKVQTELMTRDTDFSALVAAYQNIWKRFN